MGALGILTDDNCWLSYRDSGGDGVTEEAVVVERNAAILAVQHLVEQGRGYSKSADVIADKVQRIVLNQWGTSKVPRFEDENSGGWLIDVSTAFDNEAMYAVVRSKDGQRTVTHIVEEDDAFSIMGRQPAAPATPEFEEGIKVEGGYPPIGVSPVDGELEVDVDVDDDNLLERLSNFVAENIRQSEKIREFESQIEDLKAQIQDFDKKNDSDVLLRWSPRVERTSDDDSSPQEIVLEVWSQERIVFNDVAEKVRALLISGVDPEQVEIWTKLRKPRFKVELV